MSRAPARRARRFADIPAHRQAKLRIRLLKLQDAGLLGGPGDDIDQLVCASYERPCVMRQAPVEVERVAVLGDDGRYHLRLGGRLHCMGTRTGHYVHVQRCHWWRHDAVGYRFQIPIELYDHGERGEHIVRWKVRLADTTADPADIPPHGRCPVNVRSGQWPPHSRPSTPKGRIRKALVELAGPNCHACNALPGKDIDHDHATGLVRGLLCGHCNSKAESCAHIDGCAWADYLNEPPAASLQLRYPK